MTAASGLVGTRQLMRLALRRDRLMIPLWLLAMLSIVASTVGAFSSLYPDVAGRVAFASGISSNATFRALTGIIYDDTTIGGLTAWRVSTLGVVLLGLMSVFVVTRHTRQEEETGRLELLGSTVLGRRSPLAAGLLVAFAANLVAALISAALLIGAGEAVAGSLAMGFGIGLGGAVYAGVAAVAAQLTESSRAANGIASATVALGYLLRAIGDSAADGGGSWLTWLSPIGWSEQVRPFAGNRWQVLALLAGTAAVLALAAGALNGRRDFGASLVAARPGPARAGRGLAGVWSLAWRLHRTALIGWLVGFALIGVVYGGISNGITEMVHSTPQFEEIFRQLGGPGAILDAFFASIMSLFALVAAAFGISAMLRLRAEETAGRLEPVLSTPVPRLMVFGSHLGYALGGPTLVLLAAGMTTGIAADAVLDDGAGHLAGLFGAALVQLPAIWVLSALAAALIGWGPNWAMAAWGALALCAILGQLGPVLQLPQWVMDLSPFTHTPKVPGVADVSTLPLIVLSLLAAALVVSGVVGFRRRDIG